MRLGIDFGTTHTVVAMVDRGNYPVVAFDGSDVFPSLIASGPAGELRYGIEALAVRHEPGWTLLRSVKRLLNDAGQRTEVEIGGTKHLLLDVVTGFLERLHHDLLVRSNAGLTVDEPVEVAVSVPANASSAQRFLTIEAFKAAGFDVVAVLNEPSAAGFEYANRYRSTITSKREYVLVYDLGGGTFDASLLNMADRRSEVVTSEGVRRLGGDDFDQAILEVALGKLGLTVTEEERSLLLEECARQKEAINPQTRRLLLDMTPLDLSPLAIPIDEIYAACQPLVERSIESMSTVLRDPFRDKDEGPATRAIDVAVSELAGLYLVGGSASFPLVPRLLKEKFGEKRVKRSPHPFAATAIGLAVYLDRDAGYTLEERFTRCFGVFREAEGGGDVTFDPIFPKDTKLPQTGEPPLEAVRRYRAAHNIGHFRFLECGRVEEGRPEGDLTPWDEIRFAFDPGAREAASLPDEPVVRLPGEGPDVEERYLCGSGGDVEVRLTVLEDGFTSSYRLARHG